MSALEQQIKAQAHALGFELAGIAPATDAAAQMDVEDEPVDQERAA